MSPSEAWCVIEQHETDINDASFRNASRNIPTYSLWAEMPSARHRKGCSLSFVDGHVERHRWLERSTLEPVTRGSLASGTSTAGQKRDLQWTLEHATALPDP